MTIKIKALLSLIIFTGLLAGCQLFKVDPGSDPLVVNVERLEASAVATFDFVLNVDNADRGFWRTNALAFHGFCEWLRAPMVVDQTNQLPRGLAMVKQLDNVKLAYKSSKADSNAVNTVFLTLQSAFNQASAWATITTNTVH